MDKKQTIEFQKITFEAFGSIDEKRLIIEEKLRGLGKSKDAVEYRLICHIDLFGDRHILQLNSKESDILIRYSNSFTIIPLWDCYLRRFGYWSLRYYAQLDSDSIKLSEYQNWINSLKEPMKSKFQSDGFENCRGVLNFQRFLLESRDLGMDEYLEKNMSSEDWEQYKSR